MKSYLSILFTLSMSFSIAAHASRSLTFSIYPLATSIWTGHNLFLECSIVNVSGVKQNLKIEGKTVPALTKSNMKITAGTALSSVPTPELDPEEAYSVAWGTHNYDDATYNIFNEEMPYKVTITVDQDRGAIQAGCVFFYKNISTDHMVTAHTITVNGGRPF